MSIPGQQFFKDVAKTLVLTSITVSKSLGYSPSALGVYMESDRSCSSHACGEVWWVKKGLDASVQVIND